MPTYHSLAADGATATFDFSKGYTYLLLLAVAIIAIAAAIIIMTRKKIIVADAINPGIIK
jgi:hypothetical protein